MARRALVSPTGKPIVLAGVHPNAGLEAQYRQRLLRLVEEMQRSYVYWITVAYRQNTPLMAEDAANPAKALIRAIKGLGKRWLTRFDRASKEMAEHFATKATERADGAMADILKRGGFTVQFKPTAAVNDVLAAAIQENVSLIKSIASQHFTAIEGHVMRAVQSGHNLKQLTDALQDSYGVTRRRAAFIAKDQSAKATAVIMRVRQQEIGVTKAIWLHSAGGNKPRPEHVGWSGKEYDIATGMWSEVDQAWVWPGTAINCRCISKSIVPGYNP